MGIIYIYVHIQCMTNHHDYGWSWLAFQCVRLSATAAAAVDGTQMGLVFSWILWHVERSGILMDTGYPKITWAVFKTPVAWCFFGGLYYQKNTQLILGITIIQERGIPINQPVAPGEICGVANPVERVLQRPTCGDQHERWIWRRESWRFPKIG